MTAKKEEEGMLGAMGIPPIEVTLPCINPLCIHPHGKHTNKHGESTPCRGIHEIEGETEATPCQCEAFAGAFQDGSPRAAKLRQLTAPEWEMLGKESTMPIRIALLSPEAVSPEDYDRSYAWMGKIVRAALTHVRNWNKRTNVAEWHPCRVVPAGEHPGDPWECTLEQLDHGGRPNVGVMAKAVIADLGMLPPGVEVLALQGETFREDGNAGGGSAVASSGKGLRENAPRDRKRPGRRTRKKAAS